MSLYSIAFLMCLESFSCGIPLQVTHDTLTLPIEFTSRNQHSFNGINDNRWSWRPCFTDGIRFLCWNAFWLSQMALALLNSEHRCCSKLSWLFRIVFLDITPGFLVTCKIITRLANGVIFIGQPLLGRVNIVLNILSLYMICLTVDCWSPNSLRF